MEDAGGYPSFVGLYSAARLTDLTLSLPAHLCLCLSLSLSFCSRPAQPAGGRDFYEASGGDTDLSMLQLRVDDGSTGSLGVLTEQRPRHVPQQHQPAAERGQPRRGELPPRGGNQQGDGGTQELPGSGPFVAAFASTNLGDVSPNTGGAKCVAGPNAGQPCDPVTSTCPADTPHGGGERMKNEQCIASGPGGDMFESVEIIARKQYEMAKGLMGLMRGGDDNARFATH